MGCLACARLLLIVSLAVLASNAEPQFGYYNSYSPYQQPNYFRQYPHSSFQVDPQPSFERTQQTSQVVQDPRLFFNTFTLTVATTTSTVTSVLSTTCTTSTSAIKACSPSGRRRRGMSLTGDKKGRGLFYNEQEQESADGSIYLPVPKKIEEVAEEKDRTVREAAPQSFPVPFMVQPGFKAPDELGSGRFLVALATATVLTTTSSTYTATLTAICKSTSDFLSCSSSGK